MSGGGAELEENRQTVWKRHARVRRSSDSSASAWGQQARTDKKENNIFLICSIRKFSWDRVQSHICEGLPNIWGNAQIFSPYMRRSLVIYALHPIPLNFLIYEENFISFFISAVSSHEYIFYSIFLLGGPSLKKSTLTCKIKVFEVTKSKFRFWTS